jgi:LysM repeat protein
MVPATVHGAPDGSRAYVVQPGDSLFAIARQHGVTVADLVTANGLTITSVIHPGQQLAVPAATSAPTAPAGRATYTVRPGDSLFAIAQRLGVSSRSLLAANGLTVTSVIHPGQQLAIPAATSAPTAPAGNPPAPMAPAPTPANPETVERIIRDVWPDALEQRALAIAWRESRYAASAQSQCCSGLFQIYYDVHRSWLATLGINSRDDLYDARTNAEAAYALYRRAGGWGPWTLTGA